MICQYPCFIRYLFTSDDVKREFTDKNYNGYNSYTFHIQDSVKKYIDIFLSFRSLAVTLNEILILKKSNREIIDVFMILEIIYYDSFSKPEAKDEIAEKRILSKIEEELSKLEAFYKIILKKKRLKKVIFLIS